MRVPVLLPSFEGSHLDVVGCGFNMVDQLIEVSQHPEPDTKQPIRAMDYSPGGQVATAMVACARLGLRARYFGKFGAVTSCYIPKDADTWQSRGFGFVSYRSWESVKNAMATSHELNGCKLFVQEAWAKEPGTFYFCS